MWILFFATVALSFGLGFLKTGSIEGAAVLTAWIAPFVFVASYFAGRRYQSPSRTERAVARAWLLIRRTVCFMAAAFSGTAAVMQVAAAIGKQDGKAALVSIVLILAAGLFVWTGIYGTGRKRTFADDRTVHQERKRRYGWK